jgi:three-Cys-motif partner protein
MVAQRPWGFWTESKLDMLSDYLSPFTTASKIALSTVYLDLFAGQVGNISKETGRAIEGSLLRALRTDPPFTVLRGFELNTARAASLQVKLRADFPDRDVLVHAGDVHEALPTALQALDHHRKAPTFAFIDPEGVEARWELLETLAAHKAGCRYKVELFLLLISPQIKRVVHDNLDEPNRVRAEQQITDLFGTTDWQPILVDRHAGILDPERTRDELTNLMRWRLERTLGYQCTHTLRLTNVSGSPLYDMIFATDHPAGDNIMKAVYSRASRHFRAMRGEARDRRRDRKEQESGLAALFSRLEVATHVPLPPATYQHSAPVRPYGSGR